MNGRDNEAWLDTLLQRPLPSGPSDEDFREQVLERLPPRGRPLRRAFLLGLTGLVAATLPWLSTHEGGVALSFPEVDSLLVPSCLGTALLWYLSDRFL